MCSALYRTGIPTLLGFHCRIHANNIADFYEFLTSKPPCSFWGLRSLEFCFDPFEDRRLIGTDEIRMVADILSRATKIRRLSISGDLMDEQPAIFQAIAALPALESFNLKDCGDASSEQLAMLTRLCFPLTSLGIELPGEEQDIVTVFSYFRHTLK